MVGEETQNPYVDPLGGIGTRLNEIEEKQRILKDRILLIGENLISFKEEFIELEAEIRKKQKNFETKISSMERLLERIVREIGTFAKKSELDILKKQMKMFEPFKK